MLSTSTAAETSVTVLVGLSTETVHVSGVAPCISVKLPGVMVVPSIAWLKVTLGFLLTDTSDAPLTGRLKRTFSAALASAFASRGASGGASNPLFPSLLASPPPFASDAVSVAASEARSFALSPQAAAHTKNNTPYSR